MLAAFFIASRHRDSHKNFTAGDLNRAVLLLGVPVVLEMVQRPYHHKQTLFIIFHGDLPDMNQSMYDGLARRSRPYRPVKAGWYRLGRLGVNL